MIVKERAWLIGSQENLKKWRIFLDTRIICLKIRKKTKKQVLCAIDKDAEIRIM